MDHYLIFQQCGVLNPDPQLCILQCCGSAFCPNSGQGLCTSNKGGYLEWRLEWGLCFRKITIHITHNTGMLHELQLFFAGDNPDTEAVRRAGSEQEPTSALRGKQCFYLAAG